MTPAETAYAYYDRPDGNIFHYVLDYHLKNGYVFSTPQTFVMGRPVDITGNRWDILDLSYAFPKASWNCWFVYFCAGDLKNVFTMMPFSLPYCSFEHRNRLRFYSTEQYISRFKKNGISTIRASKTSNGELHTFPLGG
jgi:hypothetical protein